MKKQRTMSATMTLLPLFLSSIASPLANDQPLASESRGYGPTLGVIPAWGTEYIYGVADLGYTPYLFSYNVSASFGAGASEPAQFWAASDMSGGYSLQYDWNALAPLSWVQVSWSVHERSVGPTPGYTGTDALKPLTAAQEAGLHNINAEYYQGLVNVQLQALDAGDAGVAETRFRLNNQDAWQAYHPSDQIPITGEGTHDLYFGSWDNNGNIEEARHEKIKIDNNDPQIDGLLPREQSYQPYYNFAKDAWQFSVVGKLQDSFPEPQDLGLLIDATDPNILGYEIDRPVPLSGDFTVVFTLKELKGSGADLVVVDDAGRNALYRVSVPENTPTFWLLGTCGFILIVLRHRKGEVVP